MKIYLIVMDYECPLVSKANVALYRDYDAVLGFSDISTNCNKYYMMQILNRDNKAYFIWTRSGRVGTIGNRDIQCFLSAQEACAEFEKEFLNKTGIKWEDRATAATRGLDYYQYVPTAHKAAPTRVEDAEPSEISGFLDLIYDPAIYVEMAKAHNIDTKRLPFDALKPCHIEKIRTLLNEISQEVLDKRPDVDRLTEMSSKFYSMLPTISGRNALPAIDNIDIIRSKFAILEDLLNVSMITCHSHSHRYEALNAEIAPLARGPTYDMIVSYLNATKGYHNIKFKCLNILEINKGSTFAQSTVNHQLLWHGTGLSNAVSIIKNGLSLTPGTVRKTGSMFGNGLYFANCSTKSLQYVRPNSEGEGILFLCEVALGNPWHRTAATNVRSPLTESDIYTTSVTNSIIEFLETGPKTLRELEEEILIEDVNKVLKILITNDIVSCTDGKYKVKSTVLPHRYHSVLGVGQNHPDPADFGTIDDVHVPRGKLIKRDSKEALSLQYDEYIVYNQNQVRVRYAVVVKSYS